MIEKSVSGTGIVVKTLGDTLVCAADYVLWYRLEDEFSQPSEWGGELATINRIRAGEYILELDPDDGRRGRIRIESGKAKTSQGIKSYRYVFVGLGELALEAIPPAY
jgi:hypothetical protein